MQRHQPVGVAEKGKGHKSLTKPGLQGVAGRKLTGRRVIRSPDGVCRSFILPLNRERIRRDLSVSIPGTQGWV